MNVKAEAPDEIQRLWREVKKPDTFIQLRRSLAEFKQPLAKLACNIAPEITRSVETHKKARSSTVRQKKVEANSSIGIIARALRGLFTTGEPEIKDGLVGQVVDIDENLNSEEARLAEERLMRHNRDADPVEFDKVFTLFILIGRWFYEDLGAILLQKFLDKKLRKSSDLPVELGNIPRSQVDQRLALLKDHQFLIEHPFEPRATNTHGAPPSFSIWACDLNIFVDSANYRICSVRRQLALQLATLRTYILVCPNCSRGYHQSELNMLASGGKYTCRSCVAGAALVPPNNSGKIAAIEQLARDFDAFVAPAADLIKQLLPQSSESSSSSFVPATPGFFPPATPTSGGSTFKRPGQASSSTSKWSAGRNRSTPRPTPLKMDSVPSTPQASEAEMEVAAAPVSEFDLKPLLFAPEHPRDVYIQAVEDPLLYQNAHALHLAKTLLDDTALFIEIIERSFEEYGIERRIKVFQYRYSFESLYLAKQRGYRSPEIARLLMLLAPNDMIHPRLNLLIMDEARYRNHFGVVSQLLISHGGPQHWLCSRDEEQMAKLLSIGAIRINIDSEYHGRYATKGDYQFCVPLSLRRESDVTIESIKHLASRAGIHIIDEYDFSIMHSPEDRPIEFGIKVGNRVRDYQKVAVERIFWDPLRAHSGILVLPCGAGKTLIGINIMAALKRPTIIFCQSALAVHQWREQILRFTNLYGEDVFRFASAYMKRGQMPKSDVPVIVSTYSMFSTKTASNRAAGPRKILEQCRNRCWGLMILDEVHGAPADTFREVTNGLKVHTKIGLTATLVREDEKIDDIPYLVGPKLFELDIFTLRMQRHISVVNCHEIQCPMSVAYQALYDTCRTRDSGLKDENAFNASQEQRLLFITNLNKVRACAALIKRHIALGHKIMVFCDDLFGLKWYSLMLQRPMVQGETQLAARNELISKFRNAKHGDCLLFSRVGDQSIDLPEANVVIQLAIIAGSRMQELQRVGRVQRPAEGKTGAWFYSLVSAGTEEARFARHRREYLIQHGYEVTVHNPEHGFAAFVDGQDSALLTPDRIAVLEDLMGKSIRNELAQRTAETKQKKKKGAKAATEDGEAASGGDQFLSSVMSALGVAPVKQDESTPKKAVKRKAPTGPEIKPDPNAPPGTPGSAAAQLSEAAFSTPAAKRSKTAGTIQRWSAQSKKK